MDTNGAGREPAEVNVIFSERQRRFTKLLWDFGISTGHQNLFMEPQNTPEPYNDGNTAS